MSPLTPINSSTYLSALTGEICKKFEKALDSPSSCSQLMQQVFSDIVLEIDVRAKEIIKDNSSNGEITSCLYFFDVLADHYVHMPKEAEMLVDLIVQLWSQTHVSSIFALLFHKWLFEVPCENSQARLRYASALIQGASNVFWLDTQSNSRRFFSLFSYLMEDVALIPVQASKIPVQGRRDLYLLLSRFIFFYKLANHIKTFLEHFPAFPNTFLTGGPADIFVIELTDQLHKLKVEPVLLHYLSNMRALQGMELRMTTSTRLKVCLYSFTSPGGPVYPTRAVRHAAWNTLDFLFPVGRYPRHLISLFFRLLYPWYWPSSCWNFAKSFTRILICFISRMIDHLSNKGMEAKQS